MKCKPSEKNKTLTYIPHGNMIMGKILQENVYKTKTFTSDHTAETPFAYITYQ